MLELAGGAAGAAVVATELFLERFVTVNDTVTPLDVRFRRETATTLTCALEKMRRQRMNLRYA